MTEDEIMERAEEIGRACLADSVENDKYSGFVRCYARKGAAMALRAVADLLPSRPDPDVAEVERLIAGRVMIVNSKGCVAVGVEEVRRELCEIGLAAIKRGRELERAKVSA